MKKVGVGSGRAEGLKEKEMGVMGRQRITGKHI
jgi:hypothetical protein